MTPRRPQERPKRENTNRKIELSAPRCPQDTPRGPQDAPRGPQEAQKRPQRGPKTVPQRPPNCLRQAPSSHILSITRAAIAGRTSGLSLVQNLFCLAPSPPLSMTSCSPSLPLLFCPLLLLLPCHHSILFLLPLAFRSRPKSPQLAPPEGHQRTQSLIFVCDANVFDPKKHQTPRGAEKAFANSSYQPPTPQGVGGVA